MNRLRVIRKTIFQVPQKDMAALIGCAQSTLSRWERNERQPALDDMARIREAAAEKNIKWDDRWFFEDPPAEAHAPSQPRQKRRAA